MDNFAIWIDRERASLFCFRSLDLIHRHYVPDQREKGNEFYLKISNDLLNVGEILILGPGVAKHHFQTYLVEQRPDLARKIVGCCSVNLLGKPLLPSETVSVKPSEDKPEKWSQRPLC